MTKTHPRTRRRLAAAAIAASLSLASTTHAVLFYSTGDPSYNTTAPTDPSLLNSGWQYEGTWSGFLGTSIAPEYFISANHINATLGGVFTLNNVAYTTVPFADGSANKVIPGTDLAIWRVNTPFSSYAPLYKASIDGNEGGKSFVVFGRGTQRGAEVPGAGWQWADNSTAGVERWGQNIVTSIVDYSVGGDQRALMFTFDRPANANNVANPGYVGPNEAALSYGDSGGAVFINSNGTWKLAGINLGVFPASFSYTGTDKPFSAALYDIGGLYYQNASGQMVLQPDSANDVPTQNYASRISPNATAILYYTNAWRNDANGVFSSTGSSSWSNILVPTITGGVGYPAFFGSAITQPRTVNVTGAISVGSLGFDNANRYTLSGSGSLTLDNPADSNPLLIGVQSGSHTVAVPVTLNKSATVNVAQASSTLTFTKSLAPASGATVLLTKTGAGTIEIPNLRGAGLTISGGTVKVLANGTTAGTSLLTSLYVPAGKLDLADNDLVIDYTGTSPNDNVRNWLLSGRSGGSWTGAAGIVSSAAAADPQFRTAIGYAEASQLGVTSFSGQNADSTSLVLKYTWYGDANLDGVVTLDDYTLLDRGMAKGLTGWVNGDFNYDGVVNAADYALIDRVYLQQSGTLSPDFLASRDALFGDAYVSQLLVSLPEPSSLAACAMMSLLPLARRRRS